MPNIATNHAITYTNYFQVRNCGEYYVYYLNGTPDESCTSYCAVAIEWRVVLLVFPKNTMLIKPEYFQPA